MVIRWISALLIGLACPACLGEAYKIDQQELRRLATQPTEERGSEVRATQLFGQGDHPRTESQRRNRELPRNAGAEVAGASVVVAAALVEAGQRRRARHGGSRNGGSRDRGSRNGGSRNGSGGAAGTALAVGAGVVILAGVTVVGGVLALGIEEGRRFDGTIEMHPTHALYLRREGTRSRRPMWRNVRLTDLTPELAEWADSAVVDERDGYIDELARAPLDRRGLFTSLYGGFSEIEGTQWGAYGFTRVRFPSSIWVSWPSSTLKVAADACRPESAARFRPSHRPSRGCT